VTGVDNRLITSYTKGVIKGEELMTLSSQFIKAREDFANWYDSKAEEVQEFIDEVSDNTCFIIDEEEYDAFMELLEDIGIDSQEQFMDRFHGEYEGTGDNILSEFAREFYDSVGYDTPDHLEGCVDYESVWHNFLDEDFYPVEFKGNTYFFNNNR